MKGIWKLFLRLLDGYSKHQKWLWWTWPLWGLLIGELIYFIKFPGWLIIVELILWLFMLVWFFGCVLVFYHRWLNHEAEINRCQRGEDDSWRELGAWFVPAFLLLFMIFFSLPGGVIVIYAIAYGFFFVAEVIIALALPQNLYEQQREVEPMIKLRWSSWSWSSFSPVAKLRWIEAGWWASILPGLGIMMAENVDFMPKLSWEYPLALWLLGFASYSVFILFKRESMIGEKGQLEQAYLKDFGIAFIGGLVIWIILDLRFSSQFFSSFVYSCVFIWVVVLAMIMAFSKIAMNNPPV